MKCPKCGYVSFDHLDHCKKCHHGLVEHKTRFGLGSLFFRQKPSGPSDPDAEPSLLSAEAPAGIVFDFNHPEGDQGSLSGGAADSGATVQPEPDESADDIFAFALDFPSPEPSEEGPRDSDSAEQTSPPDDPLNGLLPSSPEQAMDVDEPLPELPAGGDAPEGELLLDGLPPLPTAYEAPADTLEGTLDQPLADGGEETFDFAPDWEEEPPPDTGDQEKAAIQPPSGKAGKENPKDPFEPRGAAPEPPPATSPLAEVSLLHESRPVDAVITAPLPTLFLAGLLDLAILAAVFAFFLLSARIILSPGPHTPGWPDSLFLMETAVPFFLVLFLLCFGYFTLLHFFGGQTLGKMCFKLRVEDSSGHPVSFSQALIRSAGGLISWLFLGAGFLGPLIRRGGRSWNDRMAGTRVVAAEPLGRDIPSIEEQSAQRNLF